MATRSTASTRSRGSFTVPRLSGDWLTRGVEGRFSAYLPWRGEVMRWTEGPDGWRGPEGLGGDGLAPFLAVAQGTDRYVHLVGLRRAGGGADAPVSLVHTTQFQTGRPALGWDSLGHPNGEGLWTGDPCMAVNAQGLAHVFVRNGGGGVSARVQHPGGGWHPWWDLGGTDTDASPVAAVNGAGTVELYAVTAQGVVRYVEEEPGGRPVRREAVGAAVRPGTATALTGVSGHVTLYFCDAQGRVCLWSPGRSPYVMPLVEAVGEGPLASARCVIDGYDCTVLAQHSATGRLAFAAYPTEQEMSGAWWYETGESHGVMLPALHQAMDGGLVALAVGEGPTLVGTRQNVTAEGLTLDRWRSIM